MVYKKKVIAVIMTCVLLCSVLLFPAKAAQGTANLIEFTFQYYHRYTSGLGTAILPVDDHSYRWISDIDLSQNTHLQFALDTRILPGYTYHFKIMFYMGEDSVDDNFWDLESEAYCVLYDGDTRFLCYPTIERSYSNTFTTFDIFLRFEPSTDRGNQVSAGNYTSLGLDTVLADFSETPFEYDGVFVSLKQFSAVFDYDGTELDAMIAGFSDVKRGLDSVGNKLDEIGGKLDDLKDDIKSGYEYEEQRANEEGDERLSEGEDALGGVLDLSAFTRALSSLWGAISYEGYECEFVLPEVRLPQFDGFGGNVLIQQTSTDFGFWFQRAELQTPLLVVKFLTCFGAAWYLFTDVTRFMSSLFEGGKDE